MPSALSDLSSAPSAPVQFHLSSHGGASESQRVCRRAYRFGSLVKMPLLKYDRSPLPVNLKTILEEGLSLYKLHTSRHGSADSTKGSYAKEWVKWEKPLRETLFGNTEYLNSIQEMVRLMRKKRFPAAFKCYYNFHKVGSISNDNLFYKMVIHVHSDPAFRRYHKELSAKRAEHFSGTSHLWPLYRGFCVDINLFKANKDKAAEIVKSKSNLKEIEGNDTLGRDGFTDEDANLMIELKVLTYKLRTFLIRNGLSILFKEGPAAYKAYYLRQMKIWGTSVGKERELSKMLDEPIDNHGRADSTTGYYAIKWIKWEKQLRFRCILISILLRLEQRC